MPGVAIELQDGECLRIVVRPRLQAAAMLLAGIGLALLPIAAALLVAGRPEALARVAAAGPWALAVFALWAVLIGGAGIALVRFAPRSREARLSHREGTGEALRHFWGAPSVRDAGVILQRIDAVRVQRLPRGRGLVLREELAVRDRHSGLRVIAWVPVRGAGAPAALEEAARAVGAFLGVPVARTGEPLPRLRRARRPTQRDLPKVAEPPVDVPGLRWPGRCMAAAGAALAGLFAAFLALQFAGALQTGHLVAYGKWGGARHYDWNSGPGLFVFQLVVTAGTSGLCALMAGVGAWFAFARRPKA
ncbi:hypothetical protein [Acidovorax sp. NCPPB 4044]|uniref:hypothetical protein n=1 Tax=Acidovorax sp. NCPPB 4044 TaxID=2940490 RepID=UPI002303ABDE|nr:hypothetical protein [Acidovorax sp. NCPPB 4044]MDA8523244.1 hypothetical protein [Acidovorax sp. NCPPB 4044]